MLSEWHNVEVGKGYQAKHVIRQSGPGIDIGKIVDMRYPVERSSTIDQFDHTKMMPNADGRDENLSIKSKKRHRVDKHDSIDTERDKAKRKQRKAEKEKRKKDKKDRKRNKEESKSKKRHKECFRNDDESGAASTAIDNHINGFNPLLQLLATRISNKTREFTVRNGY